MTRCLLGPATMLALGVGAICAAVAGLVAGGRGALSAAAATALVLGFLWFGQLPVAQAARGRARLGTALLILGYTVRVAAVLLALRLLTDATAVDGRVFGVSVVLTALGWTAGGLWSLLGWRSATIEPERVDKD
jgi:ATP synthase protein I